MTEPLGTCITELHHKGNIPHAESDMCMGWRPGVEEGTATPPCSHDRLTEEGQCRSCGMDCRGIPDPGYAQPVADPATPPQESYFCPECGTELTANPMEGGKNSWMHFRGPADCKLRGLYGNYLSSAASSAPENVTKSGIVSDKTATSSAPGETAHEWTEPQFTDAAKVIMAMGPSNPHIYTVSGVIYRVAEAYAAHESRSLRQQLESLQNYCTLIEKELGEGRRRIAELERERS